MSSVIIIRQARRIALLTDGAAYDADGLLTGMTPKVIPLPHLNAAVAVRGIGAALALVAAWLTINVSSYDDIEHKLPDFLHELTPDGIVLGAQGAFDFFVAGFSLARGSDSYVLANHALTAGLEPFVPIRTGPLCIGPGTPEFQRELYALYPLGVTSVEELDAEDFGLKVMEAQRRRKFPMYNDGGEGFHMVGSFAQLTDIRPDRIETRILRRWNDPMGQPIRPLRPH